MAIYCFILYFGFRRCGFSVFLIKIFFSPSLLVGFYCSQRIVLEALWNHIVLIVLLQEITLYRLPCEIALYKLSDRIVLCKLCYKVALCKLELHYVNCIMKLYCAALWNCIVQLVICGVYSVHSIMFLWQIP